MTRQEAGLNAIRRIQGCINDFLAKGSYGLDPGKISPLTAYDVQVALCQYKKQFFRRCRHEYVREPTTGPRDNGEYTERCRLCGDIK